MRICNFILTTTNLSYGQKYWHFSDHTNFILTCSSGALYNNKGRYTVSKLGLLATTFWQQTTDNTLSYKSLWYSSEVRTSHQACCTTDLLHYSTSHDSTVLFMAMALLYNTKAGLMSLSSIYVVFLFLQQQHCHLLPSCSLCIILHASTWLQLPALSNPWQYELSFTSPQ